MVVFYWVNLQQMEIYTGYINLSGYDVNGNHGMKLKFLLVQQQFMAVRIPELVVIIQMQQLMMDLVRYCAEYCDECGVCEGNNSCFGCTDENACNYDESYTIDDGSCLIDDNEILSDLGGCEGAVSALGCDFLWFDNTISQWCPSYCGLCGCNDSNACNYNPLSIENDGSCIYVDGVCDTCVNGIIIDNDADNDGVCDDDEVLGCTDDIACNYYDAATENDGSCFYTDGICETCSGELDGSGIIIANDEDDDGVCDADEVLGCTDGLSV